MDSSACVYNNSGAFLKFIHLFFFSPIQILPYQQVVGISRIELQVSDKIEQGSSVPMSVQLFDTLGHPLGANVLHFVKLQPHLGSSIVRVKASEGLDHTLEGVAFGETTVAFSTAAVRSSVVNVQVFAPLKITPRNVTLVLGATMQVVSRFCFLWFND